MGRRRGDNLTGGKRAGERGEARVKERAHPSFLTLPIEDILGSAKRTSSAMGGTDGERGHALKIGLD